MTDPFVSPRGIILQYVENGALVCDGCALYVDNLLDCFDSWDQTTPLKAHILQMYRQELSLLKTSPKNDIADSITTLWTGLYEFAQSEQEDKLRKTRKRYLENPKETILALINSANKTRTFNVTDFSEKS
jgi:hypothetical protein